MKNLINLIWMKSELLKHQNIYYQKTLKFNEYKVSNEK